MEELYYIRVNGQYHFIHEHIPKKNKGLPFLFLNPIFDEKKRSQQFYAETARKLCVNGYPVIRFDYYGTGDSEGQLFELDLKDIHNIVKAIVVKVKEKYSIEKVNLLGLRFGADIALEIAGKNICPINQLLLIEPIVIGRRYMKEQRLRRKIFFKLNKISNIQDQIEINEKKYEDHQGYPISIDNLDFLTHLDSTQIEINECNIIIFKLNALSSRKEIITLNKNLEETNEVRFVNNSCSDFWTSLEAINTNGLSEQIISEVLVT